MSLNTALSGLSAASADLKVTGNNIANASTVGFKSSRAEFSDIYSASLQGIGTSLIGSGVRLSKIAQQFDQGNITFTDNRLDLAIDGGGFFVMSDKGSVQYTRAGTFSLDNEGYMVGAGAARVQGFTANQAGQLTGLLGDIQLKIPNLQPRQTGLVQVGVNVDARQDVLSSEGTRTVTRGGSIGVARLGLPISTPTILSTSGAPTPFDYSINTNSLISASANSGSFNFVGKATSFDISLAGSSVPGENKTVSITLDKDITSIQGLIADIRDNLAGTGIGIDVRENPAVAGRLQFYALNSGENSVITVDPAGNASFGAGVVRANVESVLGGIALGQAGGAGSSNVTPTPYGGAGATGGSGNKTSASFDIVLSGSSGNNGAATIVLNKNITNVATLIADIRDDLQASGVSVDVREDPGNAGRVQFFSTIAGEPSTISINNIDSSNNGVTDANVTQTLALATGASVAGIESAANGYLAQSVDVIYADSTLPVSIPANADAAEIAAIFNAPSVPGVSATASTTAKIVASGFQNITGTMSLKINGVAVSGNTIDQIAASLNAQIPGLVSVSAAKDANGDLVVNDRTGRNLVFSLTGGPNDQFDVEGAQGLGVTVDTTGSSVGVIGGSVTLSMDSGVTIGNTNPAVTNIFGVLNAAAFEPFELNTFDPGNQGTYNSATSMKIFDSLGNPHTLSLYFVKERFTPGVAGEESNRWTMYSLIDGKDVGDPDSSLPAPDNVKPTRLSTEVRFDENGQLSFLTSSALISNWIPLDENGNPTGAVGPQNLLAGGTLPIVSPPTSSNFEIRLTNSTQFGSDFAVNNLQQDGYSTGRVDDIDIGETGIVKARFSNGLTQTLGQIALANFKNVQGLRAVGDSSWTETGDSGNPIIGAPATGSLGAVNSGALEDSTVDLSRQLVNLIVAQRNFQANARTITTVNELTQTIINI